MSFIVAIDGYSGTGKGTLASLLSKKYNLMYLDTGATYRCLTLAMIRKKIKLTDIDKIEKLLKTVNIEFKDGKTYLDGEDVSKEIREKPVNDLCSPVSHIPEVRKSMVDLQRRMSEGKDVVLDGRDIGTVVFPNADVKFFLDCDLEERAKRRYKQNQEKGIEGTLEDARKNIEERDANDKSSDVSPVKQAEDAYFIDNTNITIDELVAKASKVIDKKKRNKKIAEKRIASVYYFRKDNVFRYILRVIIKFILKLAYIIVYFPKSYNKKYLKQEGKNGCIVSGNHVSYLDAAGIVLFNVQQVRFVAKHDLFRFGIFAFLGRLFYIIPVNRDKSDIDSIKLCMKSLKENKILGIFPEGTRNGLAKDVKVKNGAVYLAYKTGKKIVPVGIKGSFKPFHRVKFNYGEPFDPKDYKTDDPDWADKATEELMKRIIMLTKEVK